MKKALILTVLLLLAAIVGVVLAGMDVNEAADKVVLTETVEYGDKSALEGLKVETGVDLNYQLFWDTSFTAGGEISPETVFTFDQAGMSGRPQIEFDEEGLHISVETNIGQYSDSGIELEGEAADYDFGTLSEVLRDVASRTKNGESHTETVYMKDFCSYYPVSVSFERYPGDWETEKALMDAVRSFIRVPVQDDHRVVITIEKNDAGIITGVNSRNVEDSGINFWETGVAVGNVCYFTLNYTAINGERLDISQIPGGNGVYAVRYDIPPSEAVSVVCPLSADAEVKLMSLSKEKDSVLLLTLEDGAYYLRVLSAETGAEKQRLRVAEAGEDIYYIGLFSKYEDFAVAVTNDGQITLLELDENGEYSLTFSVRTPENEEIFSVPNPEASLAWDGERLAIGEYGKKGHNPLSECGCRLVVIDKTGIVCARSYDSSLTIYYGMNHEQFCMPDYIRVSWQ